MLSNMNKKNNFKNINNIPLLLLAGTCDPCVGGERGRKSSIDALYKVGFTNIVEINYDEMRHEILNEINKEIVIKDIINFLG